MANSIDRVQKYLDMLDEKYVWETKSSILDAPNELVLETQVAYIVLIAKMLLDGLGDYDRNAGFVQGDATVTWQSHTFTMDRGRKFNVDALDDIETVGIAFGRLGRNFLEQHVGPELDAYRFSTYATGAGTIATPATPTVNDIIGFIDAGNVIMDDEEVPEMGRILFASSTTHSLMKSAPEIQRRFDVQDSVGVVNRKITMFDDMVFVKVPKKRFYTEFDFYDGTTAGQEAGGFVTNVNSKEINFMIIHPSAVVQITKRANSRLFDPETNQSGDGWSYDYRIYHDAWVLEEKTKGIYVHHKA